MTYSSVLATDCPSELASITVIFSSIGKGFLLAFVPDTDFTLLRGEEAQTTYHFNKKHIDHTYTYQNFSVEEQSMILKAGRSNNTLDHTKLCNSLPDIQIDEIHVAMEKVFQRMAVNLINDGSIPDKLPRRKSN